MHTWPQFTARLASTLAELTDRCFLVLTTGDEEFVRFLWGPTWVFAEVSRHRVVDGGVEGILRRHGFTLPATMSGYWNCYLKLPATDPDWNLLAKAAGGVLRELFEVTDPSTLRYAAWREPQPKPPFWKRQPASRDAGQDRIELPGLGLAYRDS